MAVPLTAIRFKGAASSGAARGMGDSPAYLDAALRSAGAQLAVALGANCLDEGDFGAQGVGVKFVVRAS